MNTKPQVKIVVGRLSNPLKPGMYRILQISGAILVYMPALDGLFSWVGRVGDLINEERALQLTKDPRAFEVKTIIA